VAGALALLAALSGWWCFANGYVLYYGDAESHLNIARGIVDSRTPGYDQLGTVWLPVLHVMCLPFAKNDWLWFSGLAGSIPMLCCFVAAGTFFYLSAREAYGQAASGAAAVACFALNPNVLYLAAIPMTEIVFLAALFFVLVAILRFRSSQRGGWLAAAVAGSWVLSLTRYDGWFLMPFIGIFLAAAARRARLMTAGLYWACAALAPLYWVFHNWWETGNALDFYNGPYSPVAIQGGHWYPGYHDWIAAVHYYFTAGRLCAGGALVLLGAAGLFFARGRARMPLLFLSLTPLFYIWSMHSSGGTPIYVPPLWPFTHYNSRYGIALVPLCAFAAGALVARTPQRWQKLWFAIPLIAVLPWLARPGRENWICWKESEVNSLDRRAWTRAGTRFLLSNYETGQGILASAGDVTGIFRQAHIHLSETLNISNGAMWALATTRPDLYHPNIWLMMQEGDGLARALASRRAPYGVVRSISTSKYSPDLIVGRRKEAR
jgi:hypothetical protein